MFISLPHKKGCNIPGGEIFFPSDGRWGRLQDSGVRHFHPASNYDGIKETVVSIDVDGEMVEAAGRKEKPRWMDTTTWFMFS